MPVADIVITHHDDLRLIKDIVRPNQCGTHTPSNAHPGDPNCGRSREVLERTKKNRHAFAFCGSRCVSCTTTRNSRMMRMLFSIATMLQHPSDEHDQPDDDADCRNRFASVQGLDSAGPSSLNQNSLSSHQTASPSTGRRNPSRAQRHGVPSAFNPELFPVRRSSSATDPPPPTRPLAKRSARTRASFNNNSESEARSENQN